MVKKEWKALSRLVRIFFAQAEEERVFLGGPSFLGAYPIMRRIAAEKELSPAEYDVFEDVVLTQLKEWESWSWVSDPLEMSREERNADPSLFPMRLRWGGGYRGVGW